MKINLAWDSFIVLSVRDILLMRILSRSIKVRKCIGGGTHVPFIPDFPSAPGRPANAANGRLKQLDQGVYTQKDAEEAIGLRTDRGAVSEKMDIR